MKFYTFFSLNNIQLIKNPEIFLPQEKIPHSILYLFTLKNFLKKIFKKGLKLKIFNFFFNNFFYLFSLILKKSNSFSLNINESLNFYSNNFTFFFFVNFWKLRKAKSMRKKLKQKLMPKFIVREFFLKKFNRNRIIFKLFALKLQNLEEKFFSHKLLKLLLDLFLNFKNS